jgi:hypothetical protein
MCPKRLFVAWQFMHTDVVAFGASSGPKAACPPIDPCT